MNGSLLCLTTSHSNTSYSVGVCARYQANPKETHINANKRIICYFNGTVDCGIWYSKDSNVNLVIFSNAYWAGNVDDRKSTSGDCFYLEQSCILAQRQNTIQSHCLLC